MQDLTGYVFAHFVKYFNAVITYFTVIHLTLLGNEPTKLITQISKGRVRFIEWSNVSLEKF